MQWIVRGLDRTTGQSRMTNVDAATERDAVCAAGDQNMVVESVEPIIVTPARRVGAGSMYNEGGLRDFYMKVILWASRIGGLAIFVGGVAALYRLLSAEALAELGAWVAVLIGFGVIGVGAGVAAVGELLAGEIDRDSATDRRAENGSS